MDIYIFVIDFYTESRSPNDVMQTAFVLHSLWVAEHNEKQEVKSFRVPLA